MSLSRKGLWAAVIMGALCGAAILTMLTWPRYLPGSWEKLSPAWWQFEWLASLGIVLSLPPSVIIYQFDTFLAANEYLRMPAFVLLMGLEVSILCLVTYGVVTLLGSLVRSARRLRV
jgi:hypothetical protein